MAKDIPLRIPAWAAGLYLLLALIMVPWTAYISYSLPLRHIAAHWDITWTGLDAAITLALLLTGYFAAVKSQWVVISASTVGTLLVTDAWFDALTARQTSELPQALAMALLIELPLAAMSFHLAVHALQRKKK